MASSVQDPGENGRAVLWSTAEDGRREGQPLVLMLHGRGGKESDLFGLARFFLPETTVVASLRAPVPHGSGFEWFGGDAQDADLVGLDRSVSGVLRWLDALEFRPAGVSLMGFSQGARMVLQLLREAPRRFRSAFALSGSVAPGGHAGDSALAALQPRVPVFWAYGDDDEVIAASAIDRTRQWLADHAASEEHSYAMGHTINQAELADMKEFAAAH